MGFQNEAVRRNKSLKYIFETIFQILIMIFQNRACFLLWVDVNEKKVLLKVPQKNAKDNLISQ